MKSEDQKRNAYYLRKYGITLRTYNKMLKQQKESCDICKKHQSMFKRSLHVDHDHRTGLVRGLLCFYCNRRLVGRHTLESARKVYEYLLKHNKGVKHE